MHTLFALEDLYGLKIGNINGEVCLRLDKSNGTSYLSMFDMFSAWEKESAKLRKGEITKEEYDQWRYNYPKFDTSGKWHKIIPSQELSDALVKSLKNLKDSFSNIIKELTDYKNQLALIFMNNSNVAKVLPFLVSRFQKWLTYTIYNT